VLFANCNLVVPTERREHDSYTRGHVRHRASRAARRLGASGAPIRIPIRAARSSPISSAFSI